MKIQFIQLFAVIIFFVSCGNANKKKTEEQTNVETKSVNQVKSNLELNTQQIKVLNSFYSLQLNNLVSNSPCSGDETDNLLETFKIFGDAVVDQFPITEAEEKKYGDAMAGEIKDKNKISDDSPLRNRIIKIGTRLLPFRERKGINYSFHLVDDDTTVNAFTILGAHVYVTTGLLNYISSDDALAAIIGHEISHSDKKHCTRKVQMLVMGEKSLGSYGKLAANFAIVLGSPFGQTDEYEADRAGALLAYKAGYDKLHFTDFFAKLKKKEGKYNQIEKLMRTHPYSQQREDCLKEYISKELN